MSQLLSTTRCVSWILPAKSTEPLPFDWVATILKRFISCVCVSLFLSLHAPRCYYYCFSLWQRTGRTSATCTTIDSNEGRRLASPSPCNRRSSRQPPENRRYASAYAMRLRRLILAATACSTSHATATLSATTNVELDRLAGVDVPDSRGATGDNRKRLSLQHLESMWHTSLGHEVRGSIRLCRCVEAYARRYSISPCPRPLHCS